MASDLSLEHVRDAARRLVGKIWPAPTIRCPALDRLAARDLFLKAENLQRIGAFKARGAMHAVSRLPEDVRARGVITYSSGNHAQAVALAAREFGVPAWIAMPVDAPAIKVAGVRALGAEIVFAGTTSDDRHRAALELHARHGAAIVEPFDDLDVIAGQATATLELCEHVLATTGEPRGAPLVPPRRGGPVPRGRPAGPGEPPARHRHASARQRGRWGRARRPARARDAPRRRAGRATGCPGHSVRCHCSWPPRHGAAGAGR